MSALETAQLKLVPFLPQQLLALLESVEQFNAAFGVPAAAGLRDFYVSGELSPAWLDMLRASKTADVWRHGFAVVYREDNIAIGTAGFKGPADENGVVEIAYGVVPDYQGRGFATEAATALVEFAYQTAGVKQVIAHTLPKPNASTRVLAKCGFKYAGEVNDPEDGPVWRWEHGSVGI
jgi:[ribosomal protein S5]-alanine N-acetyltransferase